ncbi:MAG: Smr/MutS family protein [Myxococcales bacterium]|nr:Smr/MutS family protein [Myxococcales bacterium]
MRRQNQKKGFKHQPFQQKKDGLPDPADLHPSMDKPPPPKNLPDQEDDDALFAAAMADVVPLRETPHIEPELEPPDLPSPNDERLVVRQLEDLVEGRIPFDIVFGDEFIEGSVQGLDPRLLQRLRRGKYAWQAHIDLHGMRVDEARTELVQFIQENRRKGHRCLLIVHGRGNHSPDREPILKRRLISWLTQGFLHKDILAFATARPHDGGTGATYVLLRRERGET